MRTQYKDSGTIQFADHMRGLEDDAVGGNGEVEVGGGWHGSKIYIAVAQGWLGLRGFGSPLACLPYRHV
jgi:hypothetical protein